MVEVGGGDWNGNVRSCFAWSSYVSIDLHPGPGVDLVGDFAVWAPLQPAASFDLVVCLEVLEHAENWRGILAGAAHLLEAGGLMVGTCAGPARSPHGATGAPYPAEDEHYGNIFPGALCDALGTAGFAAFTVDLARSALDVRWTATK